MSNFWSNLLSAIIGAAILAAVPTIWSSIGSSSLSITYNTSEIAIPNSVRRPFLENTKDMRYFSFLPEADASKLNKFFQSNVYISLLTINIKNNADDRSKEIELNIGDAKLAYISNSETTANAQGLSISDQGAMKIPPLNPGGAATLTIVSERISTYNPNILFLSVGKKLPAYSTTIADDYYGIAQFANNRPFISYMYVWISCVVIVIVIISIPYALYSTRNIDFAAKTTSSAELIRMQKVIDRAKQIDPAKAAALQIAGLSSVTPATTPRTGITP